MSTRPVHTIIDVGSTKVCTILGRQTRDGEPEVLGMGVTPSQGLLQDTVVSINELAEALAASVRDASRAAGTSPTPALLGITGTHLETLPRVGSLRKPESGLPLSPADLEEALEAARPPSLPQGKELVHLIAREYLLDGIKGIRNPVGMHALHLEVNALAVLGGSAQMENMVKAAARAGVPVKRLVFQPLAIGDAVLSQEERHMGALVVDIGGGTTYMALFWRGVFWDGHVIPIGGHLLTNDIAVVLGAPSHGAEEVKRAWGTAQPWKVLPAETVQLPGFEEETSQEVSRKDLSWIIHDRATELFEFIQEKRGDMGLERPPAAGVVLTGGTASLPGLREMAQDILGCPVRIGTPRDLQGGEALEAPAFASSVGVLLWGLRHDVPPPRYQNGRAGVVASRRLMPHLSRVGRWLPFMSLS